MYPTPDAWVGEFLARSFVGQLQYEQAFEVEWLLEV
jgi:hypothetical protein